MSSFCYIRPMSSRPWLPLRCFAYCVVVLMLVPLRSNATPMEWVQVGNPGNAPDSTGYGAVNHTYQIGKYEVTNAQYVEFLNSVAAADPLELYDAKMANFGIQRTSTPSGFNYTLTQDANINWAVKPVNLVSWYDAIRFTNWVSNGRGNGDTETGSYTLLGGTALPENPSAIVRNADARVWLPSTDEWYKAAYYDPNKPGAAGYWTYPTASDDTPSNAILDPDPGNNANFLGSNLMPSLSGEIKLTDVGQFENSASAYGLFDAGGNVSEWSETLVPGLGMLRASMGGTWNSLSTSLRSSNARFAFNGPAVNSEHGGFRLASIPEPSTGFLAAASASLLLLSKRWNSSSRRFSAGTRFR